MLYRHVIPQHNAAHVSSVMPTELHYRDYRHQLLTLPLRQSIRQWTKIYPQQKLSYGGVCKYYIGPIGNLSYCHRRHARTQFAL